MEQPIKNADIDICAICELNAKYREIEFNFSVHPHKDILSTERWALDPERNEKD